MSTGYVALVLHAHLPFVRNPESDYVLEEEWLYEAITETYIPLLRVFDGLKRDGIDFKLTMSMTPPLVSMLADPLLQERYVDHLSQLEKLISLEIDRHEFNGHMKYLAEYYANEFAETRRVWEHYDGNLVKAFKQYLDSNNLEIITCGATHGYLPLMKMYPQAVWAQLQVACESYEEHFGRAPKRSEEHTSELQSPDHLVCRLLLEKKKEKKRKKKKKKKEKKKEKCKGANNGNRWECRNEGQEEG